MSEIVTMFQRVLSALEGVKYENINTPVFKTALEWVGSFPAELDVSFRRRLVEATCKAFSLSEAELWKQLDNSHSSNGVVKPFQRFESREEQLRKLIPKGGWFDWYDQYTQKIEVPLSYSLFSSLCCLGAALGRRVYFRMGSYFSLYPNFCVILIGPPGLKKTTAGDIAAKLIGKAVLCPVLADQVTPERMITVLKDSGHHLIYAGEMAVFFGKQKYNEGMVTKMLRMLDSPAEFIVETQTREQEVLRDLAITFLGCTTPSLLSSSMPEEVTSSGFMSRFVLVVERDTDREFPIPGEVDPALEGKLLMTLERMKAMSGEMSFLPAARSWYDEWYSGFKRQMRAADDTTAEILVRAPTHLIRTAMLIHLVQCDDFQICSSCLKFASDLIHYTEDTAPLAFQLLKQTAGANDLDYVKAAIHKLGGAADHSTLIRRVATRMNSAAMKGHLRTLQEQGVIKIGKTAGGAGTYYILTEGGEK